MAEERAKGANDTRAGDPRAVKTGAAEVAGAAEAGHTSGYQMGYLQGGRALD